MPKAEKQSRTTAKPYERPTSSNQPRNDSPVGSKSSQGNRSSHAESSKPSVLRASSHSTSDSDVVEIEAPKVPHRAPKVPPPRLPTLPDEFPPRSVYAKAEGRWLQGFAQKSEKKALIDRRMYDDIFALLITPTLSIRDLPFRVWVRKTFTLGSRDGKQFVFYDDRQVAIRENIYDILIRCHGEVGHGGRSKTYTQMRLLYSWIPRELVSIFVEACPKCNASKSKQRPSRPTVQTEGISASSRPSSSNATGGKRAGTRGSKTRRAPLPNALTEYVSPIEEAPPALPLHASQIPMGWSGPARNPPPTESLRPLHPYPPPFTGRRVDKAHSPPKALPRAPEPPIVQPPTVQPRVAQPPAPRPVEPSPASGPTEDAPRPRLNPLRLVSYSSQSSGASDTPDTPIDPVLSTSAPPSDKPSSPTATHISVFSDSDASVPTSATLNAGSDNDSQSQPHKVLRYKYVRSRHSGPRVDEIEAPNEVDISSH
ncbi:hypothetical protein BOTBODRAFT_64559 [Botryobasidium botryosum FD-172 SS1]|uniref:Integrase zinc-binding domain-containing protein n=1 Tax=Botryobasidium botryosum (strain FD-172 SS1) TaxID=930990 RepID=A0A067MNI8_BOTB1|nr:hypothetical protein BOTBODRAFT_64559 [Botryobasidium botryosum FD-172 SS1]